MPERLDPRNDVVFKMLFTSSEPALLGILHAVLKPPRPFVGAIVRNPELPKDYLDDKGAYLDVLVTLEDGTIIDVEMQCRRHASFRERALYYWAGVFADQLRSGEPYSELKRVVSVLFLDYREFDFAHFHERFRLQGQTSCAEFSSFLEIHTVELSKVRERSPAAGTGGSRPEELAAWCRFLASDDPLEVAELGIQNAAIAMAERRLEEISADPKAREIAFERERRAGGRKIIEWGERMEARAEGHAEGRAEGLAMGRAEGHAEGLVEGQRLLVRRLLTKFGPISAETEARLARANEQQLVAWAERWATARSLDEVLA
jgi:predicted transposase/invertase (TIGR01784 family)